MNVLEKLLYRTDEGKKLAIQNLAKQRYQVCEKNGKLWVTFDGEMFRLVPFDQDWYEDEDYWVHYKFVDKPRRKPKMKVVYGGAVNER